MDPVKKRTRRALMGIDTNAALDESPRSQRPRLDINVQPQQVSTPQRANTPQRACTSQQARTPQHVRQPEPPHVPQPATPAYNFQLDTPQRRYGVFQPVFNLFFMIGALFPIYDVNGQQLRGNLELIKYLQSRGVLAKKWECPDHHRECALWPDNADDNAEDNVVDEEQDLAEFMAQMN